MATRINTTASAAARRSPRSLRRQMARRRLVTYVTAAGIIFAVALSLLSAHDQNIQKHSKTIVQMELERAADAAEANGYDVYVIPGR